jgi:hypothetical protein
LTGRWDQNLYFEDQDLQKELAIQKNEKFPDSEFMFGFPKWSIITSHLTKEQLQYICPTDSRIRPDKRAYENGDVDLAASEKHRLEELQRARRRLRKENNEEFEPRWFEKIFDEDANTELWTYNGAYLKIRESGNWEEWDKGKVIDLYND